jgi:predicted MPP superfamily phosphohydrolase
MNRRKFLLGMGGVGVSTLGMNLGIGDAENLASTHRHVMLKKEGRPVRILHLSDLHLSKTVSLEFLSRAFLQGIGLNPDVICLTGDYVTSQLHQRKEYSQVLRILTDAAPTFAVFGNHDGGSWAKSVGGLQSVEPLREVLVSAGISVLHNTSVEIEVRGRAFSIVGVGDAWSKQLKPKKAFRGIVEADRTIVLSHNPDTKDELRTYPWKLMLSGHTHGGQVKLPLVGAIVAPIGDMRYIEGLKPWGNRYIHVTCGVGNIMGIRVNCPAELSLLEVMV